MINSMKYVDLEKSSVYNLLITGLNQVDHPDIINNPRRLRDIDFGHPFNLDDSYKDNVMLANGARPDLRRMIDFIFYSRDHFEVVNHLKYPDNFMYLLGKIPDRYTPSDHFSLKAVFSWLLMQLWCAVGNATLACVAIVMVEKWLGTNQLDIVMVAMREAYNELRTTLKPKYDSLFMRKAYIEHANALDESLILEDLNGLAIYYRKARFRKEYTSRGGGWSGLCLNIRLFSLGHVALLVNTQLYHRDFNSCPSRLESSGSPRYYKQPKTFAGYRFRASI
ncbi:hypothetical protein H6P81_000199 [Aristolochia fimbriata]|uniref:Uncharacterized protein n=1 Tax=Aristolochia fimbriata TaxID=158543 RepID=A0AAV7F4N9_ARIFI|nr:hypothetical protein H6P81_000199 [Aristolochia fimbriata]